MKRENETIILVDDNNDKFYNLTEVVAEWMESESISKNKAIFSFMIDLHCTRYSIFPPNTHIETIVNWILKDN